MRGRGGLAAAAAEAVAGVLLVAAVAYLAARAGLGNPLAGLGESGALPPKAVESIERVYGLREPPLRGLLGFLYSLLHGRGGPSLYYGGANALGLALTGLWRTLAVMLPAAGAAAVAAAAWSIAIGFEPPGPVRALSFVPGYFYAVAATVSSWLLGWPPPLPCSCLSKAVAYFLVVFIALWPRMLHTLSGLLRDALGELSGYAATARAVGLGERRLRARLVRAVAAPFAAQAALLAGMVLERSAVLEPLLGYTGLGRLLYSAVANADPVLAATAFTVLGSVAYLVASLGRLLEPLLDPRLRGGEAA